MRFSRIMILLLIMIAAWTQSVNAQDTSSGTKVSISGSTGTLLFSEGAGGTTYAGYWRHYQTPIQLVMTNFAEGEIREFNGTSDVFHGINAETGLFTTLPNNMKVEDDNCLALYNWVDGSCDCSYFAIIAPKGYHILRYVIDADASTGDTDFREFHLASDATVIDDDNYVYQTTATGSSTTIDRVLDYTSSRLYFKVTFPGSSSQYSFKFNKFYVYYTMDEAFSATVPNMINGEATNQFGSGYIDLGTFSANTKASVWSFTSSNVSALSSVDVYDVTSHTELGTTQLSGSPYYFTATNGDYLLEAPAKYRIVGAEINFLNISAGGEFDGYEPGSQVESVVSGNKYLIKNAEGKYISYINGALTYTDEAKTAWTVTSDGSGYTISIGGESGSTVETGSISVTTNTGTLTANGSSSYYYLWTGTDKAFTVYDSGSANNINSTNSNGDLNFHAGSGTRTYNIDAPDGYVITGYSFDAKYASSSYSGTITDANGTSHSISSTSSTVSVTGLSTSSTSFTLTDSYNKPVTFSNFTITYQSTSGDSDSGSSTTTVAYAQNSTTTVFDNPASSSNYYRIPAIVKTKEGNLLALSDLRIGGSGDVGTGIPISIVAKTSDDNGATWGTESTAIPGNNKTSTSDFDYAHGDAAVVTDSETGKLILLAASGKTGYGSGGVQLGQYYSTDNGATWSGSEITSAIKTACSNAGVNLQKQFFTSGRIIQSSKVKVGTSYRIYSAMCTGNGSVVMYSDNFGANWYVLGSSVAYSGGDETVLEELPNGDLLLSARLSGSGRGFNVFNYSDLTTGTGSWNTSTATGLSDATNCNGEMLLVPTSDSDVYVLLHSVALSNRTNVTVYYKLINKTASTYTEPSFYSSDWAVLKQMSSTTSAYSTMVLDNAGNVAFLYEENQDGGYDIQFTSFKVNVTFPETDSTTDPNIPATKTYLVHSDETLSTSTTAEVWLNNSGDLYRVQTGTSSSTEIKTATSITSGTAYYISDGNGNYLNLNGSSIVSSTTPTTKWTITGNGNSYTIKSGNYSLYVSGSRGSYTLSASSSNSTTFTYSNGAISCVPGKSTTYYLVYDSGWTINTSSSTNTLEYEATTTTPTYSTDQTFIFFDIASTKTKEEATGDSYTASLYDKKVEKKESKSVAYKADAPVTISNDDFNNDAIKFNIDGLPDGQKALFNVDLKLLPLDPMIDYVDISVAAGSDNTHIYNNRVYSSDFEFSNDGDPVTITVSSADYVADKCYIFFQNAYNKNENTINGGNGESNFFLMGSTFDMNTRGTGSSEAAYTYRSPLPSEDGSELYTVSSNWDTSALVGTTLAELTNIKEVAEGTASEIEDTSFKDIVEASKINYTVAGGLTPVCFTEDDDNTLNVYMYSCDIPLYNISSTPHIAYNIYTVKAKLQEANETPVVELTDVIYSSTLKGANNKNTSIAADNAVDTSHNFYGVKVTSKWADDTATGTAPGNLNSTAIINAIKAKIKDEGKYYAEKDSLRGILYVDMSALSNISTVDSDTNPWDTFNTGTADNCLYFMPSGFGRNVENTIEGGEGGEALGNIVIKDKQPFFSPYNFKTGTFSAQYTREITGGTSDKTVSNSTLILPFDITLDSNGNATDTKNADADETITFCTLGALGEKQDSKGKTYLVNVTPLSTGVAYANTPYHVQSTNSLTNKSFEISQAGATINKTEVKEYSSTHSTDWGGYGSYYGVAKAKTGAVDGAETFYYSKNLYYRSSKLTNYSEFYVLPFRAYFATTATIPADAKTLTITFNEYPEPDKTTALDGIEQVEDNSGNVYNVQGMRVNKNDMKRRGIYIANGKKIVKF